MKLGKFYSWEVLSPSTAIKKCDHSVFEYCVSSVPFELRWFFDVENLGPGEKKFITLIYKGASYEGYILMSSSEPVMTRIFWDKSLGNIFRNIPNDFAQTPTLRFKRTGFADYEVEFIDIDSASNEEPIPRESYDSESGLIYSSKYELDKDLRKKAIMLHGTKCMICGMDFEKVYGDIGKDFIEIHHIVPMESEDAEIEVNPETDMICVCPNCHAMIHRNKAYTMSVAEMKMLFAWQF